MEKHYCDECSCMVDTQVKKVKNKAFTVRNQAITLDIRERCCNLCQNAVSDEALDNETLNNIWEIANNKTQ